MFGISVLARRLHAIEWLYRQFQSVYVNLLRCIRYSNERQRKRCVYRLIVSHGFYYPELECVIYELFVWICYRGSVDSKYKCIGGRQHVQIRKRLSISTKCQCHVGTVKLTYAIFSMDSGMLGVYDSIWLF